MVKYPEGPPPAGNELLPGEGINALPFDAEELLDFTAPLGKCSGVYYGLMFQLKKWGFQCFKVSESIFVSPINKPYYDVVVGEEDKLEAQIKSGLASIAQAVADLELLLHDLRKYKQYLEYFEQIKKGEELIKEGKEEGKKLKIEAEQTLRSIFIDEVDVHTDLPNTPIALRSIASRWPTIISDFMKLSEEKTPEEIKLDVSNAEKIILATKNKLFLQWKAMFEQAVKERYTRLKQLVEARRASVNEYKEALRPTIARYKMIKDMLSSAGGRAGMYTSFFHPEAQAFSIDSMTIWAWKPFAPEEKYKVSREQFDKIPIAKAGFTQEEIKELGLSPAAEVDALPVEPSIDSVVRRMIQEIENDPEYREYGVKITAKDLKDARERMLKWYSSYAKGIGGGEAWVFSPYFFFLEIPMTRTVLRLPDGSQIEDLWIENLRAYTETQNIILARVLELIAKEKKLEVEIGRLLGEFGITEKPPSEIEALLKGEFPKVFEPEKKEEKKKTEKKLDFLRSLIPGIIRAKGPYEFSMSDRLAKYYQIPTGRAFAQVKSYLMSAFDVPGVSVRVLV